MQKVSSLVFALTAAALIGMFSLLPACFSSDDEGSDTACSKNHDCAGGEVCKWERCLPFCVTAQDCPSNSYCHAQGVCTKCALDDNCVEGSYCIAGNCIAEANLISGKSCKNDFECGGGYICRNKTECRLTCQSDIDCESPYKRCNADGLCAMCVEDSHCSHGQKCEDEKCIGTSDGDAETSQEIEDESSLNEPDGWPGDECGEELPNCRDKNECVDLGDASFCTHACTSSGECIFDISGGCCLKTSDTESVCAPFDYCPDIGIDGRPCTAAEACLESSLKCLKDAQGVNFCSRNCTKNSDCPLGSYPNGCCRQIGDSSWCVLEAFCK